MYNKDQLRNTLRKIDGKGYKAYKELQGKEYDFGEYSITFDYVQGDPFASPTKVTIKVPQKIAGFKRELYENHARKTALTDYLTRAFARAISKYAKGNRGTGKSGMIGIDCPGQEVLVRTSADIDDEKILVRIVVGLPAQGRRILAKQAIAMFFEEIPELVKTALIYENLPEKELINHIQIVEDQEVMRNQLKEKGLVAFIGNGSILPRRSGIDDRPMSKDKAVAFVSPPDLEVELETKHQGKVKGMGIPEGVTLLVGGGYHGKSTVLKAIERGVYNHIPGDGRERVVTVSTAFKIRAEDGRRVEKVNISPFINNLPHGQDTHEFSTEDASGSTSQAANIMEALELNSKLLLLDEDTSATNFMIRDARMQELVAKEKEPITPFIDQVTFLKKELDVSTIMVIGGSGDYFDVADCVIMMDHYLPHHVTAEAKEIAKKYATHRRVEESGGFTDIKLDRIPLPQGFNPKKGRKVKIKARGLHHIQFGMEDIKLEFVEQLVDKSQTKAIGDIIYYALNKGYLDGNRSLFEVLKMVYQDIEQYGLEVIAPFGNSDGDYALPRLLEVGAAINRLRTLQIK
ncbi:ATPase [Anoxybacter fermentans]|uniref:ATPase n=1 Tax=Anoxybacter fermentans TaxID=1323375 RepID=A0A3S9T1W6_9FIRM|nr:ABC-ATPase domain-containing protein [Anoxybacter fermentans]AZR74596.1 ATPase [Anoxybacter fermentans]